jgi:signal transduction histidine kinase
LALGAILVVVLGFIRPAQPNSPTLRSGMETAMTLVALVGAAWMGLEFLQSHRLRKLLLVAALVTLAETEFITNALPAMLHLRSASGLAAAMPLGQLIAAATLVAAASTASERLIPSGRRAVAIAAGLGTLATGLAELVGLGLHPLLVIAPVHRAPVLEQALHHPFGLAVLLGTVGLFGFAAKSFAQRGRLEAAPYLSLLAGAALLLAAGRLYYLTLPSVSSGALTMREVLRLGAFLLVLAAAIHRDLESRRTLGRVAAMAERSRVAQDLHDGLAQDLAFIASHGTRLSAELGEEHPLVVAARHALSLSRETIGELSDTSSASPGEALQAVAAELGSRFEVDVAVDVDRQTTLSREEQDNISRITREAIANAARHGEAKNVVVSLKQAPTGKVLRVSDDGRGIGQQPGRRRSEGFGLSHMRDRAALLGGHLVVRPRRAGGTDLEVLFR